MTGPAVSVVMPVRNGERWLEEACRSVLAQTLADFELIVIDDGSSDKTPAIAHALATADRRVQQLTTPAHGLVDALNLGIERATAPLIARLDADDVALPSRLARQAAYFAANPQTVLLGAWADVIDARGQRIGGLRPQADPGEFAAMLDERNPFIHSTVMMRADAVRATGGYRRACEAAEDYDLWLRLAERGAVAILPETLGCYRRHDNSISLKRAVRQAFSARLARRAARMRRERATDPLTGMAEAPDWWTRGALPDVIADDAKLARFLSLAEPGGVARERLALVEMPAAAVARHLTHAEKRLALRALERLAAMSARPPQLSMRRAAALFAALTVGRWL